MRLLLHVHVLLLLRPGSPALLCCQGALLLLQEAPIVAAVVPQLPVIRDLLLLHLLRLRHHPHTAHAALHPHLTHSTHLRSRRASESAAGGAVC